MTDWALQGQALYMGLKDKAFEALECDCGMGHEALVAHLLDGLPSWWPSGIARAQAEKAAARARLCLKPEIAEAFDSAGTPCPGAKKAAAASAQVQTASASSSSSDAAVQYHDPIIRKRLGLPPLN